MKELSIEEKAKRYDEVVEKFDVILNLDIVKESGTIFADDVRKILPELAESEDERIKKIIKDILQSYNRGVILGCLNAKDYSDCLAWLEKHSTPQVRTGLEWVNTIDDACDKRYLEEYAHGEYCHEQSFKWGFQEGVDWLEKQGDANKEYWRGYNEGKQCILDKYAKVEKQDEKKPADKIQLGKKYKCIASPRYSTFMIGKIYKPEDKFLCSLMNFCSDCFESIEDGEQKPADITDEWIEEYWQHEKVNNPYSYNKGDEIQFDYQGFVSFCKKYCQKPAKWSEEDIVAIDCAVEFLSKDLPSLAASIERLKSLRPQDPIDWTMQDEEELQIALDTLVKAGQHSSAKWLKNVCLVPQNHWKPTEEQMDVLDGLILNPYLTTAEYNGLVALKEQLKTL